MEKSVKVRLKFDANSASNPMIYYLARDFDIIFSILQADIRPGSGGRTILELSGEEENLTRGIAFMQKQGVDVKVLTKAVIWDEENCVHCGSCTAVCPHKALSIDKKLATLTFDNTKCVVCEMCIPACPTGSIRADLF